MVSTVCQDALAATLVDDGVSLLDVAQSSEPTSVDVWLDGVVLIVQHAHWLKAVAREPLLPLLRLQLENSPPVRG